MISDDVASYWLMVDEDNPNRRWVTQMTYTRANLRSYFPHSTPLASYRTLSERKFASQVMIAANTIRELPDTSISSFWLMEHNKTGQLWVTHDKYTAAQLGYFHFSKAIRQIESTSERELTTQLLKASGHYAVTILG